MVGLAVSRVLVVAAVVLVVVLSVVVLVVVTSVVPVASVGTSAASAASPETSGASVEVVGFVAAAAAGAGASGVVFASGEVRAGVVRLLLYDAQGSGSSVPVPEVDGTVGDCVGSVGDVTREEFDHYINSEVGSGLNNSVGDEAVEQAGVNDSKSEDITNVGEKMEWSSPVEVGPVSPGGSSYVSSVFTDLRKILSKFDERFLVGVC